MSSQIESWEEFATSYRKMTIAERRRALAGLSPEQRSHLDTLLDEGELVVDDSLDPADHQRGEREGSPLVRFQDFEAKQLAEPAFLSSGKYEDLDRALKKLNRWIGENDIELINVETIVLPNMHGRGEQGTEDVSIRTSGKMSTTWHQFFRVWYRA